MNFRVVYNELQVADPCQDRSFGFGIVSPSPSKPKIIAAALKDKYPKLTFVEPVRVEDSDFLKVHSENYVHQILALKRPNGFGTKSSTVNESLRYTNGAMLKACQVATPSMPACALVSGFHHAGYDGYDNLGIFCTFNGLVLSAVKMIEDKRMKKVAIIDCDMHHGNGTDDILDQLNLHSKIMNISSSYYYGAIMARLDRVPIAAQYMEALSPTDGSVITTLKEFQPDLIIYQSGADVHIDDPAGGLLDESQMFERDLRVFEIAKILNVPLAWCLAGGYQVEADGSIAKVVRFHMNTFEACNQAYLRS